MNKFLVLTTTNSPTKAVRNYAMLKGWEIVVVGDKKTPKDWRVRNVTYLSPDDQKKLSFKVVKKIPWNNYSRKMIGYLYAIKNGADIIAETDDDNYPLKNWGWLPNQNKIKTISGNGFVNMYKYFTKSKIWPRGFPLDEIGKDLKFVCTNRVSKKIGVWQFLANKQPDVDAIYRLTNNKEITFQEIKPFMLDGNVVFPFNSQNTIFYRDVFPLMYLPAFVTMRATDIIRGLIAQPIMWASGIYLGVGKATVYQNRNYHDYMKDFVDEIPVYLNSKVIVSKVVDSVSPNIGIEDNLLKCYEVLARDNIISTLEIDLLRLWINDVQKLAI